MAQAIKNTPLRKISTDPINANLVGTQKHQLKTTKTMAA